MSEITPDRIAEALGWIVEDERDERIPFVLFTTQVRGNVVELCAESSLPVPGAPFTVIVEAGRGVLAEVLAERARQDAKWGPQNHPDGTGRPGDRYVAEMLRNICKANGPAEDNWRDILAEEVAEAFAETETGSLRAELIQCAAVLVAWVEAIDRRTAAADVPGGGS